MIMSKESNKYSEGEKYLRDCIVHNRDAEHCVRVPDAFDAVRMERESVIRKACAWLLENTNLDDNDGEEFIRAVSGGADEPIMRCFVFDLAYDDFVEPVARLVIAENVSEARRLLDEYMAKDGNAHWRIVSQAREIDMSSPDSKGVIDI